MIHSRVAKPDRPIGKCQTSGFKDYSKIQHNGNHHESMSRLFHAPTRTTSSGCFMLHRTVHALWNLYGNPYRNRAETEEETIP